MLSPEQKLQQWWSQRLPYWRADPLLWIKEVLGGPMPWSRQEEILRAVATSDEVNVATGHGVGKSWLCARIALWYLSVYNPAVVITTAPKWDQVTTILWKEIRDAHNKSKFPLGGELLPSEPMLRISNDSYAKGMVANDRNSLQGFRAANTLVVIDEAAGMEPWAFESLESMACTETSKIIKIGNPLCGPDHPFAKAFAKPAPGVANIRISTLENPNYLSGRDTIPGLYSRKRVEAVARSYGRGSDAYKARILGEFPTSAADRLITPEHIQRARQRWGTPEPRHLEALIADPSIPKRLGCDVARSGVDLTAIAVVVGRYAFFPSNALLSKADGPAVARRLVELGDFYRVCSVAIDGGNVGSGAVDSLVELQKRKKFSANVQIYENQFGAGATHKDEHKNRRAELWWGLRTWLEEEGALDPDAETEEEILATGYKPSARVLTLEEKDDIKARLGRSPDRADALALAVAGHLGKVRQLGPLNLHYV